MFRREVTVAGVQDELLRALHDAHGPALFRYVASLQGFFKAAQRRWCSVSVENTGGSPFKPAGGGRRSGGG